MKYDVFISYSRKDYVDENENILPDSPVKAILDFLDTNSISYWFDKEGIYSGSEFVEVIADAITASKMMIFLSSENSNNSIYTAGEIFEAIENNKLIIPVRTDKSPYNKKFKLLLNPLDYIEYSKADSYTDLLKAIETEKERISKLEREEILRREELKKREWHKAVKEDIQEQVNELSKLKVTSKSLLESIFKKLRSIDITQKQCPVCESRADIDTEYCQTCGWFFPPLSEIDDLKIEADKSALILARSRWENKTISTSKDNAEKIAQLEKEKDILRKENLKLENTIYTLNKKIETFKKIKNLKETFVDKCKDIVASISKIKFIPQLSKNYSETLLKGHKKRYWLHLLLIAASLFMILGLFIGEYSGYYRYYFEPLALFSQICVAIFIFGIVQLLKAKRTGMLTLILNSICVFLCGYIFKDKLNGFIFSFFYLFSVSVIYLVHRSDKTSVLSWDKMINTKIKHPIRLIITTIICFFSVLYSTEYIYAKACVMDNYSEYKAEELLRYSVQGLLGDNRHASRLGNSFIPHKEYSWLIDIKPNIDKARWWYELANDSSGITLCEQYEEASVNGYYISETYGKCGLNNITNELVKININFFNEVVPLRRYSNCKINLIGASIDQGELEVEGADVEIKQENDYFNLYIQDLHKDSVTIRYVQTAVNSDSTIYKHVVAERIVPAYSSAVDSSAVEIQILDSKGYEILDSKGYGLLENEFYKIKIIGAEPNQVDLRVEGADVEIKEGTDYFYLYMKDIHDDYITIRVIKNGHTIAERTVRCKSSGDKFN